MTWIRLFALAVAAVTMVACASKRPPEPPQRLIYLAVGASDAAGIGAEPVTRGYVFEITNALDERIDTVVLGNLAVPNAGTEQLEGALELFFETEAAPGLVTVWTGANDVIRGEDVDDFEDDLEDIFDTLRDQTDGVIVVGNIPDLTLLPRFRDAPDEDVTRERIKEFNEAIADQAEDYDVLLVDLYSLAITDDLVSDRDGFHPNTAGHRRIADEFLKVILPALGLQPTV